LNSIEKIRKEQNLMYKEIAERLGLNIRTVQGYASGTPIPLTVEKLIRYEFFAYQDQPPPILPDVTSYLLKRIKELEEENLRLKSGKEATESPHRDAGSVAKHCAG